MIKIAIISLGRSHLINLARVLDAYEDIKVTFYSMMPRSRCRKFGYMGEVISGLFPIGILAVLIERIPLITPYQRSYLRIKLRIFFDKYMAWRLKRCDFVIGLNGAAVKVSLAAKRKYQAITICDQGSSHILAQDAIRRTYTSNEPPKVNTDYMLRHYDVVDYLMVPSVYVKQSDIENGICDNRILYNPYGVNLEIFKPRIDPAGEKYDVIMVGSWWKHKGCDMLAEACINRLGVKLLHVGSVIDCPLPDSPLFKHYDSVPESDLPLFYSRAKVFAMPSLDEGFGLVFLQAAACGLPVVGSSRTGVADVASLMNNPQECITINEPLSVDTVVNAIRNALDIADSLPLSHRYQKFEYLQNISWEAYGERYMAILTDIFKN